MTKVYRDISSNPSEHHTDTATSSSQASDGLLAQYAKRVLTENQQKSIFVSREGPCWAFYLVKSDYANIARGPNLLERMQTFLMGSFLQAAQASDEALRGWANHRIKLIQAA